MVKKLFIILFLLISMQIYSQEWITELKLDPSEIHYGLDNNGTKFSDVDDFASFIIEKSNGQFINCTRPIIRMLASMFYEIVDEEENVKNKPTIIWINLKDRWFYLISIDGEYAVLLEEVY
jgi:hypothetical protein